MRLISIIAFVPLLFKAIAWQLNEISRISYSFEGYCPMYTERIKAGKVSDSLYTLNSLMSPTNHFIIRKMDLNEILIWMSSFTVRPSVRMYDVDSIESKVILGIYKQPLYVLALNATTGDFISAQTL